MSDPRNYKLTDHTIVYSGAMNLVLLDELSRSMERELAAITQERDDARRQVEKIIEAVSDYLCTPYTVCVLRGKDRCAKCWRAWAAQQAKQAKEGDGK